MCGRCSRTRSTVLTTASVTRDFTLFVLASLGLNMSEIFLLIDRQVGWLNLRLEWERGRSGDEAASFSIGLLHDDFEDVVVNNIAVGYGGWA